MEIFKVLGICIITAVLALILKQQKGEYAFLISLAGGLAVMIYIISGVVPQAAAIGMRLSEYGVNTEYFKVAFKALGIGYITSFVADACRDSGQASLAGKAELAGKCAVFLISLPLISGILKTALSLLK